MGSDVFSVPGIYVDTYAYMMTSTSDLWWRHMHVHLPISSGKDILGPKNPYISFAHNFTKKHFFSKLQVVSETAQKDISKEPINSSDIFGQSHILFLTNTSYYYLRISTWSRVRSDLVIRMARPHLKNKKAMLLVSIIPKMRIVNPLVAWLSIVHPLRDRPP